MAIQTSTTSKTSSKANEPQVPYVVSIGVYSDHLNLIVEDCHYKSLFRGAVDPSVANRIQAIADLVPGPTVYPTVCYSKSLVTIVYHFWRLDPDAPQALKLQELVDRLQAEEG